jgi:hypothetical protein
MGNTEGGFYMTTNSGLSWTSTEEGENFNDIAMSPDFEDGEGYIMLGGMGCAGHQIMLSDNDGDTFDDAEDEEASGLGDTGIIYVAFDADFAVAGADGEMMIYAANDQGDDIVKGDVADTDDVNWDELEDDGDDAQGIYCAGLQVAADNALYAISSGGGGAGGSEEIDGTLQIMGVTSNTTDTVNIPDLDIDVTSGTFDDDESISVNLDDLNVVSDELRGTLYIEGDDSGATGEVDIEDADNVAVDTAFVDEDVDLTGSSLWAEIVGSVAAEDTGVFRLLLHETNNVWESDGDSDLDDPFHLWLTPGSNVLWTIDMDFYGDDPEIWTLEDTLSGSPTLSSPPDGYKSDEEEQMRISWESMRGIDEDYHVKYHQISPDIYTSKYTDGTSLLLTQLSDTSEYRWKVRAAPQSRGDDNDDHDTWSSRWSGYWEFHTALGEPPWTPTLYTPGGIWQYSGIEVELMPAFSWESARRADSYQFVLADNA